MQFATVNEQDEQQMAIQEEAGEHVSFRKIEELESFGVAKTDIKKLKEGGYHTVEAVCINTNVLFVNSSYCCHFCRYPILLCAN